MTLNIREQLFPVQGVPCAGYYSLETLLGREDTSGPEKSPGFT